jgi:hypothetical protein
VPENNIDGFWRVPLDDLLGNRVGTADFAKQAGALARCAPLGERIHLDQAKAPSPAFGPLEVVY